VGMSHPRCCEAYNDDGCAAEAGQRGSNKPWNEDDMKLKPSLALPLGLACVTCAAMAAEVQIVHAMYGMGTDVDATEAVGRLCNGRTECSFKVDSKTLDVADPAPGKPKSLRIKWSCDKKGMAPVEKMDFDTVNLRCG